MKLLSREDFKLSVFKRDSNKCIVCQKNENLAAHHIIDRSLFEDGGYFIDNGVTLCEQHHIEAEKGILSCDELRQRANISAIILPENLDPANQYDKWGKEINKRDDDLLKYPSTAHIPKSGLQKDDSEVVSFEELKGKFLVVEAKIDGANTGVSFNKDYELKLQCRGHYLDGKGDWPEFDQFKVWANTWSDQLFDVLNDRYIMYGEWMSAFHSVYYNNLPHLFLEFDIFDRNSNSFLSTENRKKLTNQFSMQLESVRVIKSGVFDTLEEIIALVGKDEFITETAPQDLEKICISKNIPEKDREILLKLNTSQLMEGLYIKWEEDGIVKGRYKYVRPDFVQTILSYGKHWLERPSMPNKMKEGSSMFKLKEI